MPRPPPSPIHLTCRKVGFGRKSCTWKVRDEAAIGTIRFVHRRDPRRTMILHRMTKVAAREAGHLWQISHFEDGIPVGDLPRRTAEDALRDGIDPALSWKLVEIRRRST